MSLNIKTATGLQRIAGSTVILDATTSEVRSSTFSLSGTGWLTQNIIFDVPMPDTNYIVNVELANTSGNVGTPWRITNKTINGFTLGIYSNESITYTGKYYAIRLVELEGYTEVQNKVNNPDSAPTENSTNLVTSGGVYDAIQNATKVFIGTEDEWEAETEKTKYQLAVLTDKTQIDAVDETTGDTETVANKNLVFKGTLEEWEALTTAEKKTYDEALITNDRDTGEVVDAVTDGDMRAVTSNAVYDADEELYSKVVNNFQPAVPSAQITVENNAGDLSTAKTYTVNQNGLLKVHFLRLYVGTTIRLKVNGQIVDSLPNYGGPAASVTNPITTGVLIAFVKAGDIVTIDCDGNGENWYIQNVTIQPISWFVS